jgi:hypothetical protein
MCGRCSINRLPNGIGDDQPSVGWYDADIHLENASVSELVSEISQQTGMTIVVASPTELEDLPRASYRFDQYDLRSAFRLLKKERGLCAYRALGGEPRPVVIVLRSCKTVDHDSTVGIAEPFPAPLVWSNSDGTTSRESGACLCGDPNATGNDPCEVRSMTAD